MSPSEQPTPVRAGEKLLVLMVLLLSLGAFMNLAVGGALQDPNTGMLGMQVLWSILYMITISFFCRSSIAPGTFRRAMPLIAVISFAFASVCWSDYPGLTARRCIALGLTLIFGLYFARRFDVKEQFRLLATAFGVCIVFSFFFELFHLNPDQGVPGWYGVFYQKNSLGRNMVLAALVFLFWRRLEPEHGKRAWLGFVGSVSLLLLARSVTSLLVLMLLLCLLPYLRWSLRKSWLWATSGIALLVCATAPCVLWASTHLESIAGGLGRDPLLTGRVPLWILSSAVALQRPWFGFGYEAFWLPNQTFTRRIWYVLAWNAPHAHNGFLELWLELGLCGVALFLGVFSYYIAKAFRFSYRNSFHPAALWPLMFLLFLFVGNLTESSFLAGNSIYFILYVAAASMLSTKVSAFYDAPEMLVLA